MSKITFRADDELVDRVERLDASKSEVMREALRLYLDEYGAALGGGAPPREVADGADGTLDDLVAERVDAMLEERLGDADADGGAVDLTISLEGVDGANVQRGRPTPARGEAEREGPAREPAVEADADARTCGQCGTELSGDHVYCPNCGEKASRRVFCDCGDELRSDWAFCPGCGRRTPAADVLDGG